MRTNSEKYRRRSEQGGVEGQRKEVNVGDYVEAAALGRLLKELGFPTDKNKIIQLVQLKAPINISEQKKEDLLNILQQNLVPQHLDSTSATNTDFHFLLSDKM